MIHINLKNNQEIREYINTMPPGRDAYYFIEKGGSRYDRSAGHDAHF